MSATLVIIIAIGVAVVFGALAFLTLARRNDVRGAGALSAETVRRDANARTEQVVVEPPSGADIEAEAAEARKSVGVGLAPVTGDTGLAPWTPPDEEALGVSRRHFFNRATISLMAAGIGTF